MKYYLLTIEEHIGDYSSYQDYLIELEEGDIETRVDEEMRTWRDNFCGREGDYYSYDDGTIIAEVYYYQEIPQEDYVVLNKYI